MASTTCRRGTFQRSDQYWRSHGSNMLMRGESCGCLLLTTMPSSFGWPRNAFRSDGGPMAKVSPGQPDFLRRRLFRRLVMRLLARELQPRQAGIEAALGEERLVRPLLHDPALVHDRSEEHTSELQSRQYLVCRLLLEKKKNNHTLFMIS